MTPPLKLCRVTYEFPWEGRLQRVGFPIIVTADLAEKWVARVPPLVAIEADYEAPPETLNPPEGHAVLAPGQSAPANHLDRPRWGDPVPKPVTDLPPPAEGLAGRTRKRPRQGQE